MDFEVLADTLPDVIFRLDEGMRYRYVNRAGAALIGRPRERIVGAVLGTFGLPERLAELYRVHVGEAIATGEPTSFAYVMPQDGAGRVLEVRIVPEARENHEGPTVLAIGRDMSNQRDAEEQLRFLVDASRLLSTSLDVDELLDAVSRIGVPALGNACVIDLVDRHGHTRRIGAADLPPDAVAVAEEFVRTSRPLVEGALLRRVIDTRAPVLLPTITDEMRYEFTGRNPDIAALLARLQSALVVPLLARGEVLGALSFAVIDDDRHLGHRELALATGLAERAAVAIQNARLYAETRDAMARMRGIFDVRGVYFCIFEIDDEANDFVFAQPNGSFAELYGYTEATMTGLRGRDIGLSEERIALFLALLRRSLASSEPVVEELTSPATIRPVAVIVSLNRIERPSGRPAVAYVGTDITERRALEVQFLQAQKMEAVGRLAGGVAHDFNNLLTVIGGCADFLLESVPRDNPAYEDAEEVKRTADRAAVLTRQLLTFSSRQVVRPRLVDVNAIVRDAERLLRRVIGEDIALELALEHRATVVHIDVGQLEQALVNLAVNARDAMPHGGRLVLSTERVTRGNATFARIAVQDSGTGMDEATRARIFEPFFTTKPPGKGTGLGLATVFGIVKQAGGQVLVDSTAGVGSTFALLLPEAGGQAHTDGRPNGATAAPRGHERVLLVEDDPRVRHLTHRVLEMHGYTVIEAASGQEALAALPGGTVDLLLTDVVLPGVSGRELFEAVAERHPGVRVLFMSGYAEDALVHHRVSELGAPFLEKPFAVAALVQAVRDALDA